MPVSTRRNIILTVAVLFIAAFAFSPAIAHAQGPRPGGKILFGGAYTLASGETLDGDLLVFGGVVTIQRDAEVDGDVAVIGGTAVIDGRVDGDIVALGGTISLGPSAEIDGDATAIGGVIDRDPAALVHGNIVETNPKEEMGGADRLNPDDSQIAPPAPDQWEDAFDALPERPGHGGPFGWLLRMFLDGMSAVAWTAILAALGVFMVLLAPRPTERVANAMRHNIILAFGVGLIASLLSIPVMLLLAITICLIPIAIAIPFILLIAWLFGWLSLGWLFGKEILKSARSTNATPVWEVIIGVAILTLLWRLPAIMPCVGGLASFLVLFVAGNIAIGGVLLTRFGFRDYPAVSTPPAPPPPPPESSLPSESTLPAESQQPIIPPPPPPAT